MKRLMTYSELNERALRMWALMKDKAGPRELHLISVVRGGTTLGHRLAVLFGQQLNFYSPKSHVLHMMGKQIRGDNSQAVFFIEDLIAKGRTYENVRAYMLIHFPLMEENRDWFFCPLVIDRKFVEDRGSADNFPIFGSIESDWIVFPYEDEVQVVEGDRGLFRDGTGQYGKDKQ